MSAHNHSHDHGHTHAHASSKFGMAFIIAIVLNLGIVILQVIYGLAAHSTALLADAAHNTGDVIGLVLSGGAYMLAQRQSSERFTYGLRSSTILATALNGMLLLVATGAIVWEALRRFLDPGPVEGGIIIIVAVVAIVLNSFSAWLLSRGGSDLNIRSAFWHLVSDAAVSAGVVVAGVLIIFTGIPWIDSVASILIAVTIVWSTWNLFKESVRLTLQAVPASIDVKSVRAYLEGTAGLVRIHDLHIWPISTTETALTCHFVVQNSFDSNLICDITDDLSHRFGIGHATIQLESDDGKPCKLEKRQSV